MRLSQAAAKRSVALVDAPVSGGVAGAREGALAIACAGPEAAFSAARPVLDELGNHIVHVSERPGDGDLVKTINNLLSAANLLVAAEGLALAISAGLDPARLVEFVNSSTGASNATQVKVPRYVLSRAFDAGFTEEIHGARTERRAKRRAGADRSALQREHRTAITAIHIARAIHQRAAAVGIVGIGAERYGPGIPEGERKPKKEAGPAPKTVVKKAKKIVKDELGEKKE